MTKIFNIEVDGPLGHSNLGKYEISGAIWYLAGGFNPTRSTEWVRERLDAMDVGDVITIDLHTITRLEDDEI